MIARLFKPLTPAEVWAEEREKVAKTKPHLVLVDPRPKSDFYVWHRLSDLVPVKGS